MKLIVLLSTLVFLTNASKFTIPSFMANWHKAHELCSSTGQQLVTIDSTKKQAEVHAFIKSSGEFRPKCRFWIGASDLATQNTYSWVHTGRLVTFTNWAESEPNSSAERCVELIHDYTWTNPFGWNDNNCAFQFRFICETV
ncbi:lectin subunit alpha-like [Uranotaenia lowii]|uniref:lectin subunit alpha-like n=1 Tax=Uranotaenia lowii TaxID=190385 RepID=UPI0024790BE7|nr:lectin subunit alpha-like [Uranotaenia lowii]